MKRLALVGMPNTGKSTFFNRVTGASARVGNWPGVTVDLLATRILLGGDMVELVDLPGIYDLHGFADDERIVRHFLEHTRVDLVAVVLNAAQIDRQLTLALQLRDMGVPCVLLLNMSDEARQLGISIDTAAMARDLGLPVALMAAKHGHGHAEAMAVLTRALATAKAADPEALRARLAADDRIESDAAAVLKGSVVIPERLPAHLTDRVDQVLLHPWFGLPLFFAVMLLLFQGVFWLGEPLQDALERGFEALRAAALLPLLSFLPAAVQGFLLDGVYAGVVTVAAFVPLIILFFLFMAVVEDSGYLSRAAFLTDALMAKLGLDGRSFVMVLMGFGCNVPAAMGTRIMRSRGLRLLTMMVIPVSLCSARLQVFLFLTAAIFTARAAPFVIFSLYVMSFVAALVTAVVFKGRFRNDEPFVLELPPYRLPTLRQIAQRAWLEVQHFLRRATKFIVGGVILVWLLTHLPGGAAPGSDATFAGMLGTLFQPVLAPIGIDERLTVALIFGFVAKEVLIGAFAVIFGLEGQALAADLATRMDWVQAYSFMLFTLIYTPCLSTIATLRAEARSAGFATLSVAWSVLLAWLASFAFYQAARHLGY
ncbi:MAG: ferrous iron transport protein B [Betaproteobacteria bacterium]|nr:ferrous iron transport protein B [Betaproteobacteria bacterium]